MSFGFDWNGNGRHDVFDDFMNMKVTNSAQNDTAPHGQNRSSDGGSCLKSLLIVGVCVLGFVLPVACEFGGFGAALSLLGAVWIGYQIAKSM